MLSESPLLSLPGAVAGPGGVAAHYGETVAEQRMLEQGRALVDLSDHGVVTITGPDRLGWIDSLTSQAVSNLAPGQSAETLLLDPNGRIEHSINLVDDGTTTWMLVDGDRAAPLAAWLDRMRFMMRVEVADASAEWATLAQLMPEGAELLVEPAAPNGQALLWIDPWVAVREGGWQYAAAEGHPGATFPAVELLVPRSDLPALGERVGAGELALAGALALEALRVAAWRPRLADVDERSIPHEHDWMRSAVHLNKGCYRGQETVAKVHNLGHPPRRLVMLHLDGSASVLPEPGSMVLRDGVEVGRLTASARHHELGPVGLALIKRSVDEAVQLEVPAVVREPEGEPTGEVVPVAAAQQTIVPPGAGATAGVPRLPRLGAVRR